MASNKKYTDEMLTAFEEFGKKYDGNPIPYDDVTEYTDEVNEIFSTEFSQRMVAGKLRHMGFALETKNKAASEKKYTEDEENTIREMCSDPDNLPFQEEVAEAIGRDCKSIGGKLISMNIYGVLKRDKKVDTRVKLFTPEDEVTIMNMINSASEVYVEDLAEALGKEVKQVRGKLAGMRIKGVLTRNKVSKASKIYTDELLARIESKLKNGSTLEDIAKRFELKVTGLQSILAKKGLIEKSTGKKFWTDERNTQLNDLVVAGNTRDQVAAAMNTTVAVVGKQVKKLGLVFVETEAA